MPNAISITHTRLLKKLKDAPDGKTRRKAASHLRLFLKTMPKMIQRSRNDLLSFDGAIVICVSSDLAMMDGISTAVNNRRIYNRPQGWGDQDRKLRPDPELFGTVQMRVDADDPGKGIVFNLVTHSAHNAKTDAAMLTKALQQLRSLIEEKRIYRFAMPVLERAGDGEITWHFTRKLIKQTFQKCPVAIEIFCTPCL